MKYYPMHLVYTEIKKENSKMLLGIDIGNTNVVCALIDNGTILRTHRFLTKKNATSEYYENSLNKILAQEQPQSIIISSVVPEINEQIKNVCTNITGTPPLFVSSRLNTGLHIKYDYPEKLGADLITGAAGAAARYKAPVIIVDIGTATTISVVNENNDYLGGLIAPGPATSMKALSNAASLLPEIELIPTDKTIGTNTSDCMKIGILTAHASMIDGMIDRIKQAIGIPDAKIIATGGPAKDIISMCKTEIIYDNNLLFYGLYELYKMNSGN